MAGNFLTSRVTISYLKTLLDALVTCVGEGRNECVNLIENLSGIVLDTWTWREEWY